MPRGATRLQKRYTYIHLSIPSWYWPVLNSQFSVRIQLFHLFNFRKGTFSFRFIFGKDLFNLLSLMIIFTLRNINFLSLYMLTHPMLQGNRIFFLIPRTPLFFNLNQIKFHLKLLFGFSPLIYRFFFEAC